MNVCAGSWSCENVSAEGDRRRQAELGMLSQLRAGIDVVCPVRRERCGDADARPSLLDRRDEGLYAEDVRDPREIVGEHVQGHLGTEQLRRLANRSRLAFSFRGASAARPPYSGGAVAGLTSSSWPGKSGCSRPTIKQTGSPTIGTLLAAG
jgi:hypothetical protein